VINKKLTQFWPQNGHFSVLVNKITKPKPTKFGFGFETQKNLP